MPNIDSRLLECNGEPELTANFNRVLELLDAVSAELGSVAGRVDLTEQDIAALQGVAVCIVTFDSDGGSAVTAQEVAFGEKATAPTAPTKENFTFDAWFNGETEYDFEDAVTTHLTLKAHWTAADG